jgi:uncharacterized protein
MPDTLHNTPESISDRERKFLASKLLEYGNDESVLDFSELDGFLTAIVTNPEMLPMSVWYPALWGGESLQPDWQSEEELERFLDLLLQHLTSIAAVMLRWPDEFAAHFNQIDIAVGADEGKLLSAEEWCFGYLRGVTAAGGWSDLPAYAQEALACIRLHGTEERFDEWEALTPEQQQNSISKIEPAVRQLYAAWRS